MKADWQNDDRKVVPFTTKSGLQIGRAYQPKPTPTQAQWMERHSARRVPVARWLLYSVLALIALSIVSGR